MPKSNYLSRRGDTFYFRARVPTALITAYGRTMVSVSLKTSDKEVAKVRARHQREQLDLELEALGRQSRKLADGYQGAMLHLTDGDIDHLCLRYRASKMAQDELERIAGIDEAQRRLDLDIYEDGVRLLRHAFRLQLPDAVVKTLEQHSERHAVQVSVHPSPRGVAVICATLQVGSVQMRTVCNANDIGTRGWLSSVLQLHQANWFIDVEASRQVVWVHRTMQFPDPLELLTSVSRSAHLTQDEEAYEVAFVATALADPGALPSFLEGESIKTLVLAGQPQGRADAPRPSDQDTQTVH